ncbi:MAG: hypothetical protein PWP23_2312 [Candidatus Sumerlaeota bacterium]|nr:hypothetical protein [Candidatus Sumerlaeota bacterium]
MKQEGAESGLSLPAQENDLVRTARQQASPVIHRRNLQQLRYTIKGGQIDQ